MVTDTKPFIEDKQWIDTFGVRLFMQFQDGNRIDLHVVSIIHAKENIMNDKLCKILLDKDNLLLRIPESTDEDYRVKCPSKPVYM